MLSVIRKIQELKFYLMILEFTIAMEIGLQILLQAACQCLAEVQFLVSLDIVAIN